jgi:hypothetical protein
MSGGNLSGGKVHHKHHTGKLVKVSPEMKEKMAFLRSLRK